MQIQTNSIQYLYAQMQALMAGSTSATDAGAAIAGQDVPSASADTPPPPAPSGSPSGQLSSDILSSLISLQTQPSLAQVSGQIISSTDASADGKLSLAEFEQAADGSASADDTAAASAFAKMDTDGDGQLSASELASALQTAMQTQPSSGHHRHHHHHAAQAADPTTTAATTAAPTGAAAAASASTTSTDTADAGSAASVATTILS